LLFDVVHDALHASITRRQHYTPCNTRFIHTVPSHLYTTFTVRCCIQTVDSKNLARQQMEVLLGVRAVIESWIGRAPCRLILRRHYSTSDRTLSSSHSVLITLITLYPHHTLSSSLVQERDEVTVTKRPPLIVKLGTDSSSANPVQFQAPHPLMMNTQAQPMPAPPPATPVTFQRDTA
jgi:hypothetical protein